MDAQYEFSVSVENNPEQTVRKIISKPKNQFHTKQFQKSSKISPKNSLIDRCDNYPRNIKINAI